MPRMAACDGATTGRSAAYTRVWWSAQASSSRCARSSTGCACCLRPRTKKPAAAAHRPPIVQITFFICSTPDLFRRLPAVRSTPFAGCRYMFVTLGCRQAHRRHLASNRDGADSRQSPLTLRTLRLWTRFAWVEHWGMARAIWRRPSPRWPRPPRRPSQSARRRRPSRGRLQPLSARLRAGCRSHPTPLRPRRPCCVEPRSSPASRRTRKVFETLSLAAAGGLLRCLVATGDRRLLRTFGQHNGCRGLAPALRSPHRGRICWRPPFLAIRVLHRPVRLLCGEQLHSGEFEGTPRIVSAVTFSRICRVPPDSSATERTRAPRWPAQI